MTRNCLFSLLFTLIVLPSVFGQSIEVNGTERKYTVHLPKGYTPLVEYPLVLNLHDIASDGKYQQYYSQFDAVADEYGFIVVYPNAFLTLWDNVGNSDVEFLSALVDKLKEEYSIKNCLFATGLGQGGSMAYKLACSLSLKGIAVVSGNMFQFQYLDCLQPNAPAVMHIHGTEDFISSYEGDFISSSVETTMDFWSVKNKGLPFPSVTSMPDLDEDDNSTVERYDYYSFLSKKEVILYKVEGGGHTWPGAAYEMIFYGNTNYDINASEEIGYFFSQYCSKSKAPDLPIDPKLEGDAIIVYPNPTNGLIKIRVSSKFKEGIKVLIYDRLGTVILDKSINSPLEAKIDISSAAEGLYFLKVISEDGESSFHKILLEK